MTRPCRWYSGCSTKSIRSAAACAKCWRRSASSPRRSAPRSAPCSSVKRDPLFPAHLRDDVERLGRVLPQPLEPLLGDTDFGELKERRHHRVLGELLLRGNPESLLLAGI